MKRLVALLTLVASVQAADYEPVHCDAAKRYQGAALHPTVDLTWDVSGSLDGTFDEPTLHRLAAALDKAELGTAARSMTVAVAVPDTGLWTAQRAADAAVDALGTDRFIVEVAASYVTDAAEW